MAALARLPADRRAARAGVACPVAAERPVLTRRRVHHLMVDAYRRSPAARRLLATDATPPTG